jgi:hypothetical protein
MYPRVKRLLEHQEFCEGVTLVNAGNNPWNEEHWQFDPCDFGIEGEYYNFGFQPHNPNIDVYMSEYFAGLHDDLDYDRNMKLRLIEFPDTEIPKKVTIPVRRKRVFSLKKWRPTMPSDVVTLDVSETFEKNVYKAYHAEERYLGSSSLPIILDLLGKTSTIYGSVHIKATPHVFYKLPHKII